MTGPMAADIWGQGPLLAPKCAHEARERRWVPVMRLSVIGTGNFDFMVPAQYCSFCSAFVNVKSFAPPEGDVKAAIEKAGIPFTMWDWDLVWVEKAKLDPAALPLAIAQPVGSPA